MEKEKSSNLNPIEVVKQPDLLQLIESLTVEVAEYSKLVEHINYYADRLKQLPPKDNHCVEEDEPKDVVELLWSQVYKIRTSNRNLHFIKQHLESVIG